MSDTLTRLAPAVPVACPAGEVTIATPEALTAQTASERHLRHARLMIAGAAAGVLVFAATLLHGDIARGSALLLAATMWTLAALLPLLTGRLKVGGFEGELRH